MQVLNKNTIRSYWIFLVKIFTFILILTISGFIINAHSATPVDAINSGKLFADSLNAGIADKASNPVTTDIPQYQGENVPSAQYYNSGADIENQAQESAASDPNAIFISSSAEKRPVVILDSDTDPLFTRQDEITTKALSLTDTYSDCVDLPVGSNTATTTINTCHVSGIYYDTNPVCHKTVEAVCANTTTAVDYSPYVVPVRVYVASKGKNWATVEVSLIDGSWTFVTPSDGIKKHASMDLVDFKNACIDSTLTITYNGVTAWGAAPSHVGGGSIDTSVNFTEMQRPSCANNFLGKYQIEDKSKSGDTKWVLGAIFSYKFTYNPLCDIEYKEHYSCNDGGGYDPSQLISSTCLSTGAKIHFGKKVFQDCWDTEEIYQAQDIKYEEDPLCDVLRSNGCGFVGSDCTNTSADGYCLDQIISFDCPGTDPNTSMQLCGDLISCPDGDCATEYQTQKDATDDFKAAATGMAVANEIVNEIDMDNLTIFKGEGLKCAKAVAGFSNCCKSGGWGTDLSLASCNSEEKALGIKREMGAAHYVGNFCSQNSFFGCLEKKYTYCTYPSKISRIFAEQGNAQLGRGYGSSKNPVCDGFTLQELKSLDISAMDLSEFYADVTDKAAAGMANVDPNQLIQKMINKFK